MIIMDQKWIPVCCYKHDGSVHRMWDKSLVLEETEDYIVLGNINNTVIEGDCRYWQAKDPAITFFFKDEWYNVICMLRHTGIHYYCNIASPYLMFNDTIYYVDYDLDVGKRPDGLIKILDEGEYANHRQKMHYSDKLDLILKDALYKVIKKIENEEFPFNDKKILEYAEELLSLTSNKE